MPPVAVNDTGTVHQCDSGIFNVLTNDYDPDGNTPLSLVSVSYDNVYGAASIYQNQIQFDSLGGKGTAVVYYTMQDSLGATASATLTITITGACSQTNAIKAKGT